MLLVNFTIKDHKIAWVLINLCVYHKMANAGSVQDVETNCDGTHYITQQLAIGEPTAPSLLMCSLRKESLVHDGCQRPTPVA